MIDTGLQICRRWLASADSSPLMVQGQLELDIVFPGLCCKMLFVVANIGSDGLLGTEALQSYCHTSWTCGRVSCGQTDGLRYSYINRD